MTDTDLRDNQVFLRGRLAGVPTFRDLPSGDVLAVFRLTVNRPSGERVRVDSIECASIRSRVRKSLERLTEGAEVEATGSLHRRFWRTPGGPASRYAVDVETLRPLKRPVKSAGRRAGA
jgi:single-strand DNA-binding protein